MLDKTQIHFDDLYTPVSFRGGNYHGDNFWDTHYGIRETSRYTGLPCTYRGTLEAGGEGALIGSAGGLAASILNPPAIPIAVVAGSAAGAAERMAEHILGCY